MNDATTRQASAVPREAYDPQQFFVPSVNDDTVTLDRVPAVARVGGAEAGSGGAGRGAAVLGEGSVTGAADSSAERSNVIVCSSASGGIGASTAVALLARELALELRHDERHISLVDADICASGGGMDVLLGLEREGGKRWHEVQAPLGSLDGRALYAELPQWQDVAILSFAPWREPHPQWWDVQAAVRALADDGNVVVVDAGRGSVVKTVPLLMAAHHVVFLELSVLGLARAKAHVAWLRGAEEFRGGIAAVAGVEPTGSARGRGVLSVARAERYMGCDVCGPIRADNRLCSDVLEGMGLGSVPRKVRGGVKRLASLVMDAFESSRAMSQREVRETS